MKNFTNILLVSVLATGFYSCNKSENWEQVFNGKDLTGWKHVGDGKFVIEDGMLKTEGGMGLLTYTGKKIGKGKIRVVFKCPEAGNSGVYIRIPEMPTEPWMPVHKGYEVQIDDKLDDYHITGVLYSLTKALD